MSNTAVVAIPRLPYKSCLSPKSILVQILIPRRDRAAVEEVTGAD